MLQRANERSLPLLLAADAALKNNRSQVIDLMANELCDDDLKYKLNKYYFSITTP